MKRRIISILLAVCMVMSLIQIAPASVEASQSCTCKVKCKEGSMNQECPVCSQDGASVNNCRGLMSWTEASTKSQIDNYEKLCAVFKSTYYLVYQKTYYFPLEADISVTSEIIVPADADIVIDLNGHSLVATDSCGRIFDVNGKLTIWDSKDTGTIIGDSNAIGIIVNIGGTVLMEGGTVENCASLSIGGGVVVADNGKFEMTGGIIKNNSALYLDCGKNITVFGNGEVTIGGNAHVLCCDKKVCDCTGNSVALMNEEVDGVIHSPKMYVEGGSVKGDLYIDENASVSSNGAGSTVFDGKVENNGRISAGWYSGNVVNGSTGTITGGFFNGQVNNSGTIADNAYVNVKFYDNASNVLSQKRIIRGQQVTQPASPAPSQYGYKQFDGWYNGKNLHNFNTYISSDTNLKAKFSNPYDYSIGYNLDGGTAQNPTTYNVETESFKLNNPVKPGFSFTGWSGTGLNGENNMNVTIEKGSMGNKTYQAHFVENTDYTVSFDTSSGSAIKDKTGLKWTDSVLDGVATPTRKGYIFTGWKCGDTKVKLSTTYGELALDSDAMKIVLVAQWVKNVTFATKEQLMNSFSPDENGYASQIGKLSFGKNGSGEAVKWYILGKDAGVEGDNTIIFVENSIKIFAENSINGNMCFDDEMNDDRKQYNPSWGCTYPSNVTMNSSSTVYINHYGASDIRASLKPMINNSQYFTETERILLNATTVTTKDVLKNVDYTTTDKLYLLQGEFLNDEKLWVGSNDSKVLAPQIYWRDEGDPFWLRTPYYDTDRSYGSALTAAPGPDDYGVGFADGPDLHLPVRPASNINLSSVLFASAAKAALSAEVLAGELTSDSAMTLRMDGKDKAIGTVYYDAQDKIIEAAKDASVAGTVSLVVQGNDGTKDWYYSVKVEDKKLVSVNHIKEACGLSNLSLANCNIWIEKTIENVVYANMAQAKDLDRITYKVSVTSRVDGTDGSDTVATLTGGGVYGFGEYVTVTAPQKAGFTFKGWYKNAGEVIDANKQSNKLEYSFIAESEVNLVAVYEANEDISLKVYGDGNAYSVNGTTQTSNTFTQSFKAGSSITVEYVGSGDFVYWKNESDNIVSVSKEYTFTLVSATSLTAVAISSDKGSQGSYNSALIEFVSDYGQIIQATTWKSNDSSDKVFPKAPSKIGGTFEYWSIDGVKKATPENILSAIDGRKTRITVSPVYKDITTTYSVTIKYPSNLEKADVVYRNQKLGDKLTVTADSIEGKEFAYWSGDAQGTTKLSYSPSYFIVVSKDTTLYPIYSDVKVEEESTVVITNIYKNTVDGNNRLCFEVTRSIPAKYELLEQGVIYSVSDTYASDEPAMVIGAGSVYKFVSADTSNNGVFIANMNVTGHEGSKLYVKGYAIVKNTETGNTETIYTYMAAKSYNDITQS